MRVSLTIDEAQATGACFDVADVVDVVVAAAVVVEIVEFVLISFIFKSSLGTRGLRKKKKC